MNTMYLKVFISGYYLDIDLCNLKVAVFMLKFIWMYKSYTNLISYRVTKDLQPYVCKCENGTHLNSQFH
jgi:hypothetical protein